MNTSNTPPYYTIPVGNPFDSEVFAKGLRNPFRWSFDRDTYDMWIGDVGQDSWEEVNYRADGSTAGANYGWRCYEGNNGYNTAGCGSPSNYVFPAFAYATPNPAGTIIGGVVYRGTAYPSLVGYHLSADFYTGRFYKTISNGAGGWNTTSQVLSPTYIADFGETENGEVYVVSMAANSVSRVIVEPVLPVILAEFSGQQTNDGVNLYWRTTMEQNLDRYEVEFSRDQAVFTNLGMVPAQNAVNGYQYNFLDIVNQEGIIFYRLKIINNDGSHEYSPIVRITLSNILKNIIAPSVIQDGVIRIHLSSPQYNSAEVISMDGKLVLKESIEGRSGAISINVGKIARGIYAVRLVGKSNPFIQKIIIQ